VLDLPGIIEGASSGKGRGRQVVAVAKTADLVVVRFLSLSLFSRDAHLASPLLQMMLDVTKYLSFLVPFFWFPH